MTGIRVGSNTNPWLAWLKHRRWWQFDVNPPGPGQDRITEDGLDRITETGVTRITENDF